MRRSSRLIRVLAPLAAVAGFVLLPTGASADTSNYTGFIFGIDTARDGSLLVADYFQGVVRVGPEGATLLASLPEVQDVTPVRRGERDDDDEGRRIGPLWAITSGADPTVSSNQSLYRIEDGSAELVADLFAFEEANNPHPAAVDSNPFDVETLGGERALVADAGGNTLLKVDEDGEIKLVAVLPDEEVSTANAEALLGEDFPPTLPAQPVATSVAIGPDGAYYVGELKGFPAPLGESRVWRIERDARNAKCGESPKCTVVLDGLTSIIDLRFGRDGKLYVAQIDDQSWLAVELVVFGGAPLTLVGGSVHRCDVGSGSCSTVVSGKPILTSITFRGNGSLWGAINALYPGMADVVRLGSGDDD